MVASGAVPAGLAAPAGSVRAAGAASRSRRASTSRDLLGGLFGGGGGRRRLRRGGAAAARAQTPAAGRGPRDRAAPRLPRRGARRHDHGVVHRRGRLLGVPRHRRRRRAPPPRPCPDCGGSGQIAVDQGPFSFSQVCPTCGGRGAIIPTPCPHCHGRGVEVRPREVKVKIPVGVDDGQRIRVKGRGGAGRQRRSARRPLRRRARASAPGVRPQGPARPHGARAAHVHRGRARRPGEGADAHRAGHAQGEGRHAGRARRRR